MTIAIRRLAAADADAYRVLRLHALEHAPDAFGSTLEAEAAMPRGAFERRLSDSLTVGAFAQAQLAGIASMVRDTGPKEAHKGHLVGMYVHPDHRGLGLGGALVAAILDASRGIVEQLHLCVTSGNAAALQLYRRAGFEIYGVEPRSLKGTDGYLDEIEMVRMLDRPGTTGSFGLIGDASSGNSLELK